MRSFAAYVIYFRGDKQFGILADTAVSDPDIPQTKCHITQHRYFLTSAKYQPYQRQVRELYLRYVKSLKGVAF